MEGFTSDAQEMIEKVTGKRPLLDANVSRGKQLWIKAMDAIRRSREARDGWRSTIFSVQFQALKEQARVQRLAKEAARSATAKKRIPKRDALDALVDVLEQELVRQRRHNRVEAGQQLQHPRRSVSPRPHDADAADPDPDAHPPARRAASVVDSPFERFLVDKHAIPPPKAAVARARRSNAATPHRARSRVPPPKRTAAGATPEAMSPAHAASQRAKAKLAAAAAARKATADSADASPPAPPRRIAPLPPISTRRGSSKGVAAAGAAPPRQRARSGSLIRLTPVVAPRARRAGSGSDASPTLLGAENGGEKEVRKGALNRLTMSAMKRSPAAGTPSQPLLRSRQRAVVSRRRAGSRSEPKGRATPGSNKPLRRPALQSAKASALSSPRSRRGQATKGSPLSPSAAATPASSPSAKSPVGRVLKFRQRRHSVVTLPAAVRLPRGGVSAPAADNAPASYGYQKLSVSQFVSTANDDMFDTLNIPVLMPDADVDADGTVLLTSHRRMRHLNALRNAENERIGIEEAFATKRRMARRKRDEQAKLDAQLRTIIAAQPNSITAVALDNMLSREADERRARLRAAAMKPT